MMTPVKFNCVYSLFVLFAAFHTVRPDLLSKIQKDSDLSQFYDSVTRNEVANFTLLYTHATIFAPTNEAFQLSNINPADFDVLYHIANVPIGLSHLHNSVATSSSGNPLVWITRKKTLNKRDEIYVNNARIIPEKSNYTTINSKRKEQILHVIDDVLVPITSKTSNVFNPNAFDFLNQSNDLNIGKHRIRQFQDRVLKNDRNRIFQADGRYTFFIPVDEGFQKSSRPDKVDMKVIDGHVVPNHVLFTNPTPKGAEYATLANGDMLKVTVSFSVQGEGPNAKFYVQSNTLVGDQNHPVGRVLAEIVKPNIPVKNGVVHLISSPLMIVDNTVTQFLEEDPNGPLVQFYKVIRAAGGDFMQRMNSLQELTLFAPSNDAWSHPYLAQIKRDPVALQKILDLHLVEKNLTIDSIALLNRDAIYQVPTSSGRQKIYFNIVHGQDNRTLTVEGGGVNATVLTPDISATNGKIHIIDRVLGVPYMTIAEKLASDPMLNWAYKLGNRTTFNTQLGNPKLKYTYFVPRDAAWARAEIDYPSAMKKILHMTQFDYHVRQLLERHLVVSDTKAYTLADMRDMARASGNDTFSLPSVRDILTIKFKEVDREYQFEWRGDKVTILRPDVNCTNGIIHVIDRVLMVDNDVKVTGNAVSITAYGVLVSLLAACLGFIY